MGRTSKILKESAGHSGGETWLNRIAFAYTADGLLVGSTDPLGAVSSYSYDAVGRLARAEDRANGAQDLARSVADASFAVARTTTLGLTTTYEVEDAADGGQLLTVVAPDQTSGRQRNNPDGSIRITDPDGTVLTQRFGPDPRFGMQAPVLSSLSLTLPSGNVFAMSGTRIVDLADPANPLSLTTQTDTITIGDRTTTIVSDATARTVMLTSPEGRTGGLVFDDFARLTGINGPGIAPSTIEYGQTGGVARITTGTGVSARVISVQHDAAGRVVRVTDPLGQTVGYTYDDAGRRVTTIRPDGELVRFEWDANGNLLSLTRPGRPPWRFSYDERDDVVSVSPPELPGTGDTIYNVDADGRLETAIRSNGDIITLAYDSGGRVISRTVSRVGQPTVAYAITYDAAGRVATETAPSGVTVSYAYDGPFVLAQEWTGPVAGTVSYTLDEDFRLQSESVNDSLTATYQWGRDGFMTGAGDLVIGRDPATGAVIGTVLGVTEDAMTYDEFGAIATYEVTASGATPLYSVIYTRDTVGRVTELRESLEGGAERVFAYSYDALGRLARVERDGAVIEEYGYDLVGNRTTATVAGVVRAATHDVQDRLLTEGTTVYDYDANGRLVNRTTPGGTTTFGYEALGALETVTLPDGREIAYLVDSQGHRVGKMVDNVLVQGFVYGGGQRVLAELDGTGTVVSRFVYAGDVTPAWMTRGSDRYRLVTDQVGSVRLVVDAATGAIVQRLDYDAFGNVTLDTNPGFQPFGFGGGLWDRDTGLVRFGVRDYDPAAGRFTTRDPILFAGGSSNLYTYAGNDPINGVDPLGLDDTDAWTTYWAGLAVGAVEGVVATLDVVGLGQLVKGAFDGVAQTLDFLGVASYDGDRLGLVLDMLDLKDVIARDSLEFQIPRFCAMIGAGAIGGGAASALGKTAGKAATSAAANAAAGASTRTARGGLQILTAKEAELAISRLFDDMAEAVSKPAAKEAESSGLYMIKDAAAGNIKRVVRPITAPVPPKK